jgi:ATP-binding cassette subfamily F protein 3
LDGLVNNLYEFKDKKIKQHSGNIYEFLKKKKVESFKEIEHRKEVKEVKTEEKISDNKLNYLERKEAEKQRRKIVNKINAVEETIARLEAEIEEAEGKMSQGGDVDTDFFHHYEQLKKDLEKEMHDWEDLQLELEDFENSLEK